MLVYEDNFGFSNISEPEERVFFDFVRGQSVLTACERCERPVRLIPPKALCASCVSALEFGAPISMSEYAYSQTTLLDPSHPPGGRFCPEFSSFVRGEAIVKMSELRRKGVPR